MDEPHCDFYDWVTRKPCEHPARWITHQQSQDTGRPQRYYCDRHRPPRAHLIAAPRAERNRKAP